SGDAKHLVHGPRAVADLHDEEVARDTRALRLGSDGREPNTPRQITVGEPGERNATAVRQENEDLLFVAIGHEHAPPGGDAERRHHGSLIEHLGDALRRYTHDLTGAGLVGRLRAAVAADPQVIALVDREQSRPRERDVGWIE